MSCEVKILKCNNSLIKKYLSHKLHTKSPGFKQICISPCEAELHIFTEVKPMTTTLLRYLSLPKRDLKESTLDIFEAGNEYLFFFLPLPTYSPLSALSSCLFFTPFSPPKIKES